MHQKYLALRSRQVNICSVGKSENVRQARWLTMLPNLMVSLENENTGQPCSNCIPLVSVASRHYRSQHRQGQGREGSGREGEYRERQCTSSVHPLGRDSPGTPSVMEYGGCLLECINQSRLPSASQPVSARVAPQLWVTAPASILPKQGRELNDQLFSPQE